MNPVSTDITCMKPCWIIRGNKESFVHTWIGTWEKHNPPLAVEEKLQNVTIINEKISQDNETYKQ